jgi:hypothetical protein
MNEVLLDKIVGEVMKKVGSERRKRKKRRRSLPAAE